MARMTAVQSPSGSVHASVPVKPLCPKLDHDPALPLAPVSISMPGLSQPKARRLSSSGKARVVTDHIDTFTETGIQLKSGEFLEADIIVSATGLELVVMGGGSVSW